MKIPKIVKPFAWKVFKAIRKEKGLKIKTFPEGFKMELDMTEVIDNNLYYGIYEKEITNLFRKFVKKGMVVVDVGANIGYYTLLSSYLIKGNGQVIAFEPTTKAFNSLWNNLIINDVNYEIKQVALSNFNGKKKDNIRSSYKIKDDFPKTESLEELKDKWKPYSEDEEFLFRTLDSYNLDKLDFIKIDVDGNEIDVLKGAIKTIKKLKPLMLIEVYKSNISEFEKIMKELNYNIEEIKTEKNFVNFICKNEDG